MALKSKSFTKSGPGRRHAEPLERHRRNDKPGTTKLGRALASKFISPPQKKHPFSSTK